MVVCPQCGAQVQESETRCPICDSPFLISIRRQGKKGKVVVPVATPPEAKTIRVPAQSDEPGFVKMAITDCRACGAEMRYDEARRLFVCDYCGSLAVLPPPPVYKETRTEPADRQYTLAAASTEKSVTDLPPAFLPLLNNEEHARHHFRYWFENNDLDDIPQPVGVRAIYRPYFAFDVNVETQVTLYDKFKVPFIDLHPETPKPDQVRLLYYIYTDYSPFFLAAFDDAGGYLDDQERLANAFNCAYQRPLTELIAPQLAPNISPSKAFMQVKIQIADMECRFGETLKSRRTEDYYINIYYLNWRRRLLYLPLWEIEFIRKDWPQILWLSGQSGKEVGTTYHLYRNGRR